MRRTLAAAAAIVLLCLPAAGPAAARENHAILIGASTYPNLDERFWLKGPGNDVVLVRRFLTEAAPVPFDPANVTVLADGVEGAEAPTLGAIRAAFADLTARVAPGDFVYLHFSGHGSQAPAADPDSELDGLDELFLPVDIGPWNDTVGTVENALVDDEIGVLLDALRAAGADVWVVFDACHSGTATRAAPSDDDDARPRQLPMEALGIPEDALDEAVSRALPPADARAQAPAPVALPEGAGGLVAFFAAQTVETTPERNLPRGKPGRQPLGVFTWTLFEVLAEYPGATYRQVAQEVLRRYAVQNLARSTPLFEGDLDAVVFSAEPAPRVAQWPVAAVAGGLTLPAGDLHGVSEGSLLALMAAAADPLDAALGYVRVASADAFTARLEPVAHAGLPAPEGAPRGALARRVAPALDFGLTVALPEDGTDAAAAMAEAAGIIAEEGLAGPRLRFVPAGDPDADLRLAVIADSPRPDAVWVLPATGLVDAAALAATPSVSTADKETWDLAEVMADTLARMARARNVMRLGAASGAGSVPAVEVTLMAREGGAAVLAPLPAGAVPRLVPDDEVHLEATNAGDRPVDLNVLYIGSDWSITHMFAGRLHPGGRLRQGLLRITDTAYGRDRLILVLTPAERGMAVEDLSFLEQDALEITRGAAGASPFAEALREAGFGAVTRAAVALAPPAPAAPAPAVIQFELDTVPAD
jgi:hypothetical protein